MFRPGNLMRLPAGRLAELLDENLAEDSALQCHQTLPYANDPEPPAVCRGFFDHPRSDESLPLRLARAMDLLEFDVTDTPDDTPAAELPVLTWRHSRKGLLRGRDVSTDPDSDFARILLEDPDEHARERWYDNIDDQDAITVRRSFLTLVEGGA